MEQRTYYWTFAGGIAGLLLHLFWHAKTGLPLFVLAPHLIQGVLFTGIGAVVGVLIGMVLERR